MKETIIKIISALVIVLVVLSIPTLAWISGPRAPFYIPAAVALFATFMVVINTNPMHALLYLVLSLLSIAMIFYTLGAPFAAALEVIVYAGAILVLFVFVVMMLNLGRKTEEQERRWFSPTSWVGPTILAAVLLWQMVQLLWQNNGFITPMGMQEVSAKTVGIALYGPYLLAVELASMMLLAGLVAAYHLGKDEQ